MKQARTRVAYFCACLLMVATTAGVALSDTPPSHDVAALQARVKELEAQLDACKEQISTLQNTNQALRTVLTQVVSKLPRNPSKNFVPYDYNGMRFYIAPAMPEQEGPSKQ